MRFSCGHSNRITVYVNWCMQMHIYWVGISMECYDHQFYEQHPTDIPMYMYTNTMNYCHA